MNAELAANKSLEISLPFLKPVFPEQPGDCSNFLQRLCTQQVCLERVLCYEPGIAGIVQVVNLAFEKEVIICYSFTNWNSYAETKASWVANKYMEGLSSSCSCDSFRFHLPVPPFILHPGSVLEFAIFYNVQGSQFWDNNDGQNYKLVCQSYKIPVPKECEDNYDLQVALMEALCRMTTLAQRRELANQWFKMGYVASAFSKIQDSEFETDCRKFLNLVNGMQGDDRSVYSYPCVEVFLDQHVLLMPPDENLHEFWIDFNLGSQSISFYFCLATDEAKQENQWDTLCITENEVHSYTVEVPEEKAIKVLQLVLNEPVCPSSIEGTRLHIHFSSSLDIFEATKKVFGETKNKKFIAKTTTSVVKTTVQIIMDESGSQMLTPLKSKVSESCMYVSGSAGCRLGPSPFSYVLPASFSGGKAKVKPALEMIASSERRKAFESKEHFSTKLSYSLQSVSTKKKSTREQNIPVEKVVEIGQVDQELQEEPLEPQQQSLAAHNISADLSHKQLHARLTQRLEQVLKERELQQKNPQEHMASENNAGNRADTSSNTPAGCNVKKHLFSDTDIDNMTEISLLNSANRKPKPKVADYMRQPVETLNIHISSPKSAKTLLKPKRSDMLNSCLIKQKFIIKQAENSQRRQWKKKTTEKELFHNVKPKQKKKIAGVQRFTKEQEHVLDTKITSFCPYTLPNVIKSEEKSTTILKPAPVCPKPKNLIVKQPLKSQAIKQEKKIDVIIEQEEKENKQPVKPTTCSVTSDKVIQEKEASEVLSSQQSKNRKIFHSPVSPQESWASINTSFCLSPNSIEKTRSAENNMSLTRAPLTPIQSLCISPVGAMSPPLELPSHLRGIQASSLYKTSGGWDTDKCLSHSFVTPVAQQQNARENAELSLEQQFLHPLTASTGIEKCPSVLNTPDQEEDYSGFLNSTNQRVLQTCFDKNAMISLVTESQSSHTSISNISVICTELEVQQQGALGTAHATL
ncbi:Synaptonemal complex protein 2 [Bagarius yarrelli]|uniref:Synaptonemal complex protein 2 n=1 Tax=Bagarius yarrelli TaxID=175774 RepID=A0A556UYH9_BAGYA|nr:Synaptonemal complex protein 2 [Bagarius yarrelli]